MRYVRRPRVVNTEVGIICVRVNYGDGRLPKQVFRTVANKSYIESIPRLTVYLLFFLYDFSKIFYVSRNALLNFPSCLHNIVEKKYRMDILQCL